MSLVFQYGSNTSQARLLGPERLNGHGAVIGRAETVEDSDIVFDVWSTTNQCAASDLIRSSGQKAWGVLYDTFPTTSSAGGGATEGRPLEQIEGPNYEEKSILVRPPGGEPVQAVTFLVRPNKRRAGCFTSAKYVSWIVSGLREQGVPEPYVQHVIDVALATNSAAGTRGQAENPRIEALREPAP